MYFPIFIANRTCLHVISQNTSHKSEIVQRSSKTHCSDIGLSYLSLFKVDTISIFYGLENKQCLHNVLRGIGVFLKVNR